MKIIKKAVLTQDARTFEVRVYDDGVRYLVAGFDGEKKVTWTYTVDKIDNSDLVTVHGFVPYESLIGLVAQDVVRGRLLT